MTTTAIDDLRTRPRVAGAYITGCSPSARSAQIMWPDGYVQTVELGGNQTTAVRDDGTECHIYRRGPAYDAVLGQIEEELQRQEDEVQDIVAELRQESDERIGAVMSGEDITVVVEEPLPMSELCVYEGPHFDCETCPDSDTGEVPKHHATKSLLAGHKRSNLHKRHNPENGEE